jgi:ATP-dependent helicase/nuclease subunit A
VTAALDPARSAVVAASAGTGKTWQLAARITRLLLAGAEPGSILALTFTRKAAAEMQARVSARLEKLALSGDAEAARQLQEIGLNATPALLARARTLYEALLFAPWPLRATTLHAFAQDLVTRFALQTGTPPGFEVSEDDGALCDAAWQSLQREWLRQPEAASSQALAVLIADGRSEHALRALVFDFLQRRNDWRAFAEGTESPDGALARLQARLEASLDVRTGDEPLQAVDAAALGARLHVLCGHLERAGGAIDRLKLAQLLPVLDLAGAERHAALRQVFFTQGGEPRKVRFGDGTRRKLGSGAAGHCAEVLAQIVHELAAIHDRLLRQQTLKRTQAGVMLGVAALAAFERALAEQGRLGFAELEWRAYRLLCRSDAARWVQFRLDSRIEHLLVDEFQDTSDTQWRLLLPLLQEFAAGGERPRSAFIVGDAKQSIYGFRRANPELLAVAHRHVVEMQRGIAAELSESFRSAPAIIDLVNALFAQDAARARLPDFPPHRTRHLQLYGRVEVAPLVAAGADERAVIPFRNPLTTPRPDPENRRAYEEGLLIGRRIRALLAERFAVGDGADARLIGFGDIMILLRQRTHQRALERGLAECGVPFVGSARGTLLETVEGRDLLALLRFLASPARDLDLAHTLRTPLFALGDEDLVALARAVRAGAGSWWAALQSDRAPERAQARQLLGRWLPLARALPAHDLIDRVLSEGNLAARYEAALPPPQAARVRANLALIAQLALSTDSGRYPSLSRFLHLLQTQESPDEAPPPAAAEGAGAVRILSIHAAKGLEAPAVFLAQSTVTPRPAGAGWLVHWPAGAERPLDLLLAGSREQRDAFSAGLLAAEHARAAREDLNLLYVACTRARQFLHISGYERRGAGDWHALAMAALGALGASADEQGVRTHARNTAPSVAAAPVAAASTPTADARLRAPLALAAAQATAPSALTAHAPDPQQARRGRAIHWLLQRLSEGADGSTLRAALEARLGATVGAGEFAQWHDEARAVIAAPALRCWFAGAARAWNEVAVSWDGGHGVIDRLVDDGETLWVIDYKTERGAAADLRALYAPQLTAYREGVRRLWPGRPVQAGLVLTAEQRWVALEG